ncbi:MAG TPA: glycosyltransferase family A protein [Candidatus Paceibacterota bacterium]|nr:glycosyltransferase family A protein [Candidatus Paceibacterota bacterium]
MKISIIIPAYNEARLIRSCLESVEKERAANPTLLCEVIVVNNASTDTTAKVASSFSRVTVIDEPRKGIVWARKAGYEHSRGVLLANIDADTILPSGWLQKVVLEFGRNPQLLALTGPQVYYDLSRADRALSKTFYIIGYGVNVLSGVVAGVRPMLQGGNFVLRRDALEKIGGYNTDIEFWGEDSDVGKRLSKLGKIKWTFSFPIYASGRRLKDAGIFKAGIEYTAAFLWTLVNKKPFNKKYKDVRPLR